MRDDDSLFIATADYEEWTIEERKRFEQKLRRDRLRQGGTVPPTLASIVGIAASRFNLWATPQNLNGAVPSPGITTSFQQNQLSVTNNATIGPDQVSFAQKIVEDTSTNIHSFDSYTAGSQGRVINSPLVVWRVAFIAKAVERTRLVAQVQTTSNTSPTATVALGFDLQNGQTYGAVTTNGWTIRSSNMVQLRFGWWLCFMDVLLPVVDNTYNTTFGSFFLDSGSGSGPTRTTYTGDGSSGMYIWWVSMLPTGAWLLNNITFNDDFLNTNAIDLSDTGRPGFNWYLRVAWPNNSVIKNGGSFFSLNVSTPVSFLSVSNSILTISNDVSGDGQGLTSACPVGTGFTGQVFGYPNIIEGSCGYDPSKLGNFPVPTLWGTEIEMLVGQKALGAPFRENDIFETTNTTLHELTVAAAPPDFKATLASTNAPNNAALANQNSYATLILTPTENDGVRGLRMQFWNGTAVAQGGPTLWGPTVAPFPVTGPVGTFSDGDLRHQPLIIGTGSAGGGWLSQWDFVRVYQKF